MSLNIIKHRLTSDDKPYTLLVDVINDLKLIFSNGMTYYSVSNIDKYFNFN